VFLGDAVVETGAFFESVNFAILKKLPVLFVCENNLYSVYSPLGVRQPEGRRIATMISGLGIPTFSGDGNDAAAVYVSVCDSVAAIRAGGGPRFVEFSTYRWLEHCGPSYDNHIGYRSESEFLEWQAKEPITRLERMMLDDSTLSFSELQLMTDNISLEVQEAFTFAESSPMPRADRAYTDLYSELSDGSSVSQS